MGKILVTGATGFVGKRLILDLLDKGHTVYAVCRIKGTQVFPEEKANLFYIWGDLRNPETFTAVPEDLDAAYYLVHSMSEMVTDLSNTEEKVAEAFVKGVKKTRATQLIYLGGIINDEKALSPHLKSRLLVEKILMQSGISTTILRASLIIGSGSASFEIVRDLCEKLPVMVAPKWVKSLCQPIAIQDVLFYLVGVLQNPACYNKVFDIGGADVLTFKQVMQNYSSFQRRTTYILDVPFLSPRLSSYWLFFVTSVRFSLCYYLVESMKNSTVVKNKEIQQILPHSCLTYKQSLEKTFDKISKNQIVSTWMDSWETPEENPDIQHYLPKTEQGCLKDEQIVKIKTSKDVVIDRIWRIGGKKGYYAFDWAWSLRGLMDKMVGGIGLNRGRRDEADIQAGDSIDFWRVLIADKENGHLVLFSNMKVPGEAWLIFKIVETQGVPYLIQTALFRPEGIRGYLYWYSLYFMHWFLFRRMASAIAEQTAS